MQEKSNQIKICKKLKKKLKSQVLPTYMYNFQHEMAKNVAY